MNTHIKAPLPAPNLQNLHDPSGIGYADTLDPQVPLLTRVGPYVTIAKNDVIDLYCDGALALNYTVLDSDLTPETPSFVVLPLDQKFIHPDKIRLSYTVTEPLGGTQNSSLPADIQVKLTVPGGTDINPSTPWENEALSKAQITPAGVISSPEGVSVTIAAYENMALGDKITLSWNGEFIRYEIASEVEVGKPVILPVSKEIINAAGDSDMLEVRYEVRDIVNNWSRWSLPTYIEVEAGMSTLPAPVAPQAPGMELDLERLAGADVQVLVLAHPNIAAGDTINFVVERNTAEGLALEAWKSSTVVNSSASFVEFMVPIEQFEPITQGRARFKYTVTKLSGVLLRSKSLPLRVIGDVQTLAPPTVSAASNGVLDPTSHNVIAQVLPYYFMADGNDVTLVWMGKTASGANVMYEAVKNLNSDDVGKPIQFLIPDDKVSLLAGGSVEVYYTVTTFTRAFFQSPTLKLLVSNDASMPLPAPSVDGVKNGLLDPANIVLEAIARVKPYTGMAEQDKVTVHWDGRLPAGTYSTHTVLNSGTVNREVLFRVPKSFVDANQNGNVQVWYEIERSGRTQTSAKLSIDIRETVVAPLPTPTVKEAVDNTLDPTDTLYGARVIIDASANLRANEVVSIQWTGPRASDTQSKVISENEAGREITVLFDSALVSANAGETVQILYKVHRTSGQDQTSDTLSLKVTRHLGTLPAPKMDTVNAEGVVVPDRIPDSGATVRVVYPDMRAGDSVIVSWKGAVNHDSDAQTVSTQTELSFTVPKATILGNVGRPASVAYSVTRAGSTTGISAVLNLTVISSLELDASPVTLSGKIYLIPGSPNLLPTFPAGTTIQRQASGGQAPYTYGSSDEKIAVVDRNGLVQVRGKGSARITATDLQGQAKSYDVTVTGVIHCLGLGSGSFGQASTSAQSQGARLPSLEELREIHAAFGNRWPMGNGNYWSSTVAAANLVGMKWYFIKNLVTGAEFKLLHHNASLAVAIR